MEYCDQIKTLLNKLDCKPQPCFCPPVEPSVPFATVCMVTPPPCPAPTSPQPVKPLQLPCPKPKPQMSQAEAERTRYANFYNNYNIPYQTVYNPCVKSTYNNPRKAYGSTVDGQSPICCEDYTKKPKKKCDESCPTGFKLCTMKMTPPCDGHPCGVWCAEIQPCPPKPKPKTTPYNPGVCTRPCCKHWKPKQPPCKYDKPCPASCFDHPLPLKTC